MKRQFGTGTYRVRQQDRPRGWLGRYQTPTDAHKQAPVADWSLIWIAERGASIGLAPIRRKTIPVDLGHCSVSFADWRGCTRLIGCRPDLAFPGWLVSLIQPGSPRLTRCRTVTALANKLVFLIPPESSRLTRCSCSHSCSKLVSFPNSVGIAPLNWLSPRNSCSQVSQFS